MARIRSIKPEFWIDEKVAALPKATALFFIALWNFADDQGIITTSARTLSLQVPIYRSQDVHKMLNALWKAGLIKCSPRDELAFIKGWAHQKIDRPKDGKHKDKEIKWLEWSEKHQFDESTSNIRRKDRIGSDQIGSGEDLQTAKAVCAVVKDFTPVPAAMPEKFKRFLSPEDLVRNLPQQQRTLWSQIYGDEEFLRSTLLKCFAYYKNNQRKEPKTIKGWVRVLSYWFDKDWPKYQKSIPANRPAVSQDYWEKIFEKEIRA